MKNQFSNSMQLLVGFVLLFIVGPIVGKIGDSFLVKIINGGAILAVL